MTDLSEYVENNLNEGLFDKIKDFIKKKFSDSKHQALKDGRDEALTELKSDYEIKCKHIQNDKDLSDEQKEDALITLKNDYELSQKKVGERFDKLEDDLKNKEKEKEEESKEKAAEKKEKEEPKEETIADENGTQWIKRKKEIGDGYTYCQKDDRSITMSAEAFKKFHKEKKVKEKKPEKGIKSKTTVKREPKEEAPKKEADKK